MADRNMSSGFSLDDILSETEKDTEKVPGKLWSLAEIDALLADEGLYSRIYPRRICKPCTKFWLFIRLPKENL